MNALFVSCLLAIVLAAHAIDALGVGHSHHIKRQQPGLSPQLTLDVESHHGIEPTNLQASVPEYYFSQDNNLSFNFTCTIKHPSYKYKLTMTREQVLNNNEKNPPLDLIDPNGYELNPVIKDQRYSIEFTEPSFSDSNARYIRYSLLVKHMKLEDNGIFTCKYSSITKKIHAKVYKHPQSQKDIIFPLNKVEKYSLGQPTTVSCRVNDVFPKPRVTLTHSGRELTENKDYVERDTTANKMPTSYLFSVTSVLNFTPSYTDHNQNLNCLVSLTGAQNTTLTKQTTLHVTGVQIIENECQATQGTNLGVADFKIECVFFASPRKGLIYWETKEESKPAEAGEETSTTSTANVVSAAGKNLADKAVAAVASAAATGSDFLRINENDEIQNYVASVEPYGAAGSGLFKATLKIKEVRQQDLKNYTFKVDRFERTIKLVRGLKDAALGGLEGSAVTAHSKVSIFVLVAAFALTLGLVR